MKHHESLLVWGPGQVENVRTSRTQLDDFNHQVLLETVSSGLSNRFKLNNVKHM